MWIWFNILPVYEYLRKHGRVYTVRGYLTQDPAPRMVRCKYLPRPHFAGFSVGLSLVQKIEDREDLRPYASESGLMDLDRWWDAVVKMYPSHDRWLYLAEVKR